MELHWHGCPVCYEKWACQQDCTLEPDLDDPDCHPGKKFAAYCECPDCDKIELSKEFFARYNGFIK